MTSADVGSGATPTVLAGVRLGLALALTEALGDSAGLGGDTGTLGETGTTTAGASLALPSALGWLTLAEQPASTPKPSTPKQSDAAPSRSESWVPRRYPTGGGYGRRDD